MGLLFVLSLLSACLSLPTYDFTQVKETDYGYAGVLPIVGDGVGPFNDPLNPDAQSLSFQVFFESENRLHITIKDNEVPSYGEIPNVLQLSEVEAKAPNPNYLVECTEVGFAVKRKSSGETIFDASELVLEKNYIALTTKTAENPHIFGWGQRRTRLALKYPFNYTFINADRGTPADGSPHYGAWPHHYEILPSGSVHGILFFNSYPSQAELLDGSIVYRSTGGYLNFYIFLGPDMKAVASQLTELVGRPALQPHWAFGFHQCHYGYENVGVLQEVVQNYIGNNLPLDVIWGDIDYMREKRLFTTDPVNFPADVFNNFVNEIRSNYNIETVVIEDPGIKVDTEDYGPYDDLLASGAYIKNISNQPFVGAVWPGLVLFPDFSDPAVEEPWGKWVKIFLNEIVNVSGMWLDMNELSNFCSGECTQKNNWWGDITDEQLGVPDPCDIEGEEGAEVNHESSQCYPWLPASVTEGLPDWNLFMYNAVPYTTIMAGGTYKEYHNLYGFLECVVTRKVLKERYSDSDNHAVNTRPFILSRSSFIGSGHVSAIWLGDNEPTWEDYRDSIAGILNANLAGLTMSGVDAGGFGFSNCPGGNSFGNTTENLHTRWIQAGAVMYPFFRDHSSIGCKRHELYVWGEPTTTIMRHSLQRRQRIQSYLYTLHHIAHRDGTPILRPLVMEFPEDFENTWQIDTQALLGYALLVSPVLQENSTTAAEVYFPHARWYNFESGAEDPAVTNGTATPINITDVDIDSIPIHIRGHTIHTEQAQTGRTLVDMKDAPYTVVAALCYDGGANGELYVDDGISDDDVLYTPDATNPVLHVIFNVTDNVFTSTVLDASYNPDKSLTIETVKILGVDLPDGAILSVSVHTGSDYDTDVTNTSLFYYNSVTKVLVVQASSSITAWSLRQPLQIVWSCRSGDGDDSGSGDVSQKGNLPATWIIVLIFCGVLIVGILIGVILVCGIKGCTGPKGKRSSADERLLRNKNVNDADE